MPGPTYPFDFRPDAGVTVSTGNFTVAAGEYVHVFVTNGTAVVSVEGTTLFDDTDNMEQQATATATGTLYTNSTGFTVVGTAYLEESSATSGSIDVDDGVQETLFSRRASTNNLSGFSGGQVHVHPGDLLEYNEGSTGSAQFHGHAIKASSEQASAEFWLDDGDTCNGGRKVISRYTV